MATAAVRSTAGAGWLWIARAAAILLFGFFMMFVIGEGFPPLGKQPLSVQLMFVGWGIVFLGYLAGWNLPLIGGLVTIAGVAMFNVVQLWAGGGLAGPWFWLFGLPGVLYLAAAAVSRRTAANAS
ncbi:MAG: hypothetical protein DCC67_19325 [Planctomycetota bacterium]|nr:MAG: hypothetical protein DCC67_19325 [Planctomycetota bacterium]